MPATCNLYVEDRENGGFNNVYTANNQFFGYNYDAAGNLLSTGSNYNLVSMTWDAENRISSANGAIYVYDAEGNRVQKQGVSINETVYFGGRPVARFDGTGWTDLIYGPTGLLAEVPGTENAEPVFHLTDHLGTQVGSVNSSGILINPLDYTPWGQIFSGSTNDPYFFTGKERDAESGLDYFGARYYTSNMGRFMSPDWSPQAEPVPFAQLTNPQSLNLYAYVDNNPLSNADIDGHETTEEWLQVHAPIVAEANAAEEQAFSGSVNLSTRSPKPQAQQKTGRQPDGSYIAPTGPGTEIGNATDPAKPLPPLIGNGQCVTACKHFSGITAPTADWREGAAASGNGSLPIGTAIATFGSNGRYPTGDDKNSGIYMGQTKNGGILILDQWPAHPVSGTPAHPPQIREMRFNSNDMSNSAAAYHVIIVP